MKRIVSLLFVCLLCVTLTVPCFAEEFVNPPIVDGAQYLDEAQLEKLSKKIEGIRQKYNFEVAIVTEDEMSGYDAMSTADDIYDYNGYGAGENDDGIMLYICSDNREYHFTTHGKGLRYFNSNGLAYLESKVLPYLEDDNYYKAFSVYIKTTEELLQMATDGKPYNEKQYSMKYLFGVIIVCLIAPLLIAFLMMRKKLKKMKTAVENDYAANYIKPGSIRIDTSRDLFLYSRITKTERPKSSSGTHTSSSGRTHGGRGGSF